METLFQTYKLNNQITLKNRIIMAPMTRNVADDDLNPTEAMAAYYAKRADAGLIITEGTIIGPNARGYSNVPGIFTQSQIDGWKIVTDRVHENNGKIFLQLWHVGRVSHPNFLNGELPLSPSETIMTGRVSRSQGLNFGKSRALTLIEIKNLIENYKTAAKNAMLAGFDGVEIHGANGYLIDQFLHYHTNLRTDEYGGSSENMARFALAIVKAVSEEIGAHKVGLRLSPGAYLNEIVGDARDAEVFKYLLTQLNHYKLAYVHTGNFNDKVKFAELGDQTMTGFMRNYYQGTLIGSGSYAFDEANDQIKQSKFDLIAIGRPFIANPDLINKLQHNQDIISYDVKMLENLI